MAGASDYRLFFRESRRRFHTTGAVAPSGRLLGRALSRYVVPCEQPRRILEVGPGTGAVTRHIVEKLGPADRLDLVELNDAFVQHLREQFARHPDFLAVADRAEVIHQPIEQLPRQPTYDLIISGLPLNNFPDQTVRNILAAFSQLLRPGGTLSFFEYVAVRKARALVSGREERRRLREIGMALAGVLSHYEVRRDLVWPNLPPAWVHHVRFQQQEGSKA